MLALAWLGSSLSLKDALSEIDPFIGACIS